MNPKIYILDSAPTNGAFHFKFNKTLIRVPWNLNYLAKGCKKEFLVWYTEIENPGIYYLEFKYNDLIAYDTYCITNLEKIDLYGYS